MFTIRVQEPVCNFAVTVDLASSNQVVTMDLHPVANPVDLKASDPHYVEKFMALFASKYKNRNSKKEGKGSFYRENIKFHA